MAQKIEIVPPDLFETEAATIASVFAGESIAVHHLGSTVLPEIKVKPIIDLWVEVPDVEKIDNADEPVPDVARPARDEFSRKMIGLGYTPRGEQGISGRRLFTKAGDPSAHYQVHVYQFGHIQPRLSQNCPASATLHWMLKQNLREVCPAETAESCEGYHLVVDFTKSTSFFSK